MVETKKELPSDMLSEIATTLEQLQMSLEPVRDKAMDEKMRMTGYCQCAEQFLNVLVTRLNDIKRQAKETLEEETNKKLKKSSNTAKITVLKDVSSKRASTKKTTKKKATSGGIAESTDKSVPSK